MPENLLKRVARWSTDKAPNEKPKGRTIQSLRDEFDSWINVTARNRPPASHCKKKNTKSFTGKLSNAKRRTAYLMRCQELYGGK